jgi:Protein of unknown function (DUF1236)
MRALSATTIASAMLAFATAGAIAQAPPGQDMPITTRSVKLTAEQHHVIKEIVIKDLKVKSVAGDVKVEVGEPVAADVSLHSFPPVIAEKIPEVRSHSFFVKGDQVIIVDPRDKKVADVIK